jgi:hypothetical protein
MHFDFSKEGRNLMRKAGGRNWTKDCLRKVVGRVPSRGVLSNVARSHELRIKGNPKCIPSYAAYTFFGYRECNKETNGKLKEKREFIGKSEHFENRMGNEEKLLSSISAVWHRA